MNKNVVSYNERAWAIDLISEINRWATARSRTIRSAGGEWGVKSRNKNASLFPDVLLFGDLGCNAILQGWELKMPDTPVTDQALLDNSREKAKRLRLNSFIVWNARDAALHKIENGGSVVIRSWHCADISTREDVRCYPAAWKKMLIEILEYLCDGFSNQGLFSEKSLPEKLDEIVSVIVKQSTGAVVDSLKTGYRRSRKFRTEVDVWWSDAKAIAIGKSADTLGEEKFNQLAIETILHWAHRFIFAHYLKRFYAEASEVEALSGGATISDAVSVFPELSSKRDFAQIFKSSFSSYLIDKTTWELLLQFSGFLKSLQFPLIEQELLQKTMQNVFRENQRKVAGQFCTPVPLARLLVDLTVDNLEHPVFDPCCGTGTIARAVLDAKLKQGIQHHDAVKTTFAADIHQMPLQFASMSLTSGEAPFETVRVFKHNALELKTGTKISFINPKTGCELVESLPAFTCIVTNPPFIRFEAWQKEPVFLEISKRTLEQTGTAIPAKADYFVPIVLSLAELLSPDGRLGLILPNSWLGAEWADQFRKQLLTVFEIELVVTSGCGRWFPQVDVVTNLVVLRKRVDSEQIDLAEEIRFAVTCEHIDKWDVSLAGQLLARGGLDSTVIKSNLTIAKIQQLERFGLGWSAFFADITWWQEIANCLIPLNSLFNVARGERRGWDDLFFPPADCGIESEYLKPVLKSSVNVERLVATPEGKAFCCPRTEEELTKLGHKGAITWINKFRGAVNKKGTPLTDSLKRSGMHWYEMQPTTLADLATSLNPGKRLFFVHLPQRSFVNQRLISFIAKNKVDVELCHALLCSLLGCFYLEAIGFGRGLGALDLSATRISSRMFVLDPSKVSNSQRNKILKKFMVLKNRGVYDLETEMARQDRLSFEQAVLDAYGKGELLDRIKGALMNLFRIRNAVK